MHVVFVGKPVAQAGTEKVQGLDRIEENQEL